MLKPMQVGIVATALLLTCLPCGAQNIAQATLGEEGPKTPEISTEEVRRILKEKAGLILDVRPRLEFAISHLPGALNVAQKPGTSKALYISDVAEIERLVAGNKSKGLVLYCYGPYCGKSKRLAEELVVAGFSDVRRYQLGIPVWRALGGLTEIEPEGAQYVFNKDQTAVWLDTRSLEDFQGGSLAGAKRITIEVTQGGKDNPAMQRVKNDGTLPIEDHNTRIIVFGDDQATVRSIAEAVAKEAFHNVAVFPGTYAELARAVRK